MHQAECPTCGRSLSLSGEATNDTRANLRDVEIFCDLFGPAGVFITTAKGRLNAADVLPAGQTGGFRVDVGPAAIGGGDEIGQLAIRLVGSKEP